MTQRRNNLVQVFEKPMILTDITFTCGDCGRQLWYDKMEASALAMGTLICQQCKISYHQQLQDALEATL